MSQQVDLKELTEVLLGQFAADRRAVRELLKDPALHKQEGLPIAEARERVLAQVKQIAADGDVYRAFPKRFGGADDPGGYIAKFEELLLADPSLQIKAGVQYGLFAGAILHLGTEYHHDKWLPGALSVELPGSYAMTEIGHGSDVSALATTATYDREAGEFIIHTPYRGAWKEYIGNAACHAHAAVVFARLIIPATAAEQPATDHGVHAFFVPVRNPETSEFLPGVQGEDDGLKGGLAGVDNGRLAFDQVRIPRTNLLNRFANVSADGTYTSPIASPGRRFFTMLSTLVQGRVSLDGAAVTAAKVALDIAITYANQRRQFTAESDTDEVTLLDYRTHQRRLIAPLARTYAQIFAHEELLDLFAKTLSAPERDDDQWQELESLAAAYKAASTWHGLDTLQAAREACGGSGYMTENRLTSLRSDLDIYVTFEGDNTVLQQLVAKRLLSQYAAEFAEVNPGSIAKLVTERVSDSALHRSGITRALQTISDGSSARRSASALRAQDMQEELLTDRARTMVASVAGALRPAVKASREKAAELFAEHQVDLIEAARAHTDLLHWRAFTRGLDQIQDPDTRHIVSRLRDLFGLLLIEDHLDWYLINGRLSAGRARVVGSYISRLLLWLRPHAQDLVDGFGFEQEHLRATIATGAEAQRQDEARTAQRVERASGEAPVAEKHLGKNKKRK